MFVARAPEGVDVATAGAAPLAGITAVLAIDALAALATAHTQGKLAIRPDKPCRSRTAPLGTPRV